MSLITNTNLISKVYFPRLIVPAGSVVVTLVDFLISFALLALIMVWYQFWPGVRIVALIPLVLVAVLVATGPGLLISSARRRAGGGRCPAWPPAAAP